MSKVIVLCNQKGGVAKTTTAISISSYLAVENKKTLLIDIDPQGNATSGLGVNKYKINKSIYHALLGHSKMAEIIVQTQVANLFLAPANINLTGAEIELVSIMAREYKLKVALNAVKEDYDFIIIDCPPSLGLLTLNGLCAANSVMIPIQCEYYALEGLSQLMNTIKLVKKNLNNKLEIEGVVLTMADLRTNLAKEVISEVQNHFGEKVYKTIIPRSIKLTEAPGFGKPIVLYDKNSIGAAKYHELVKEILCLVSQPFVNKEVITMEEEEYGKEIRQRT